MKKQIHGHRATEPQSHRATSNWHKHSIWFAVLAAMLFANTNFKSYSSDSLSLSDTLVYMMSGTSASGYVAWKSYCSVDNPTYEVSAYYRDFVTDSATYAADSILYTEVLVKKWTQKENYFRLSDDLLKNEIYLKVNALDEDDEIILEGDYYPACPGCQFVELKRYICNSTYYAYMLQVGLVNPQQQVAYMQKKPAYDYNGEPFYQWFTLAAFNNLSQSFIAGRTVVTRTFTGYPSSVYKGVQKRMEQHQRLPYSTGPRNENDLTWPSSISGAYTVFNNITGDILDCHPQTGYGWPGTNIQSGSQPWDALKGITISWWRDTAVVIEEDTTLKNTGRFPGVPNSDGGVKSLKMGENGEFVFDYLLEALAYRDVDYNPDYDNSFDSTPDYYAVSNIKYVFLNRIDKEDTSYSFEASSIYLEDSIVKTNIVIPKGLYILDIMYNDSSSRSFTFDQIETNFEELEDVEKLKTTIYPVPVLNNAFNINVEALDDVEFEYRLMDLNSNVITSQQVSMNKGDSDILEIDFPVASYPYNMLVNVFIFSDGSSKTVKILTY